MKLLLKQSYLTEENSIKRSRVIFAIIRKWKEELLLLFDRALSHCQVYEYKII